MHRIKHIIIGLLILILIQGCGIYSFSGTNISPETKTFQVNFFQNQSPRIFPGVDQQFTNQLQDLILKILFLKEKLYKIMWLQIPQHRILQQHKTV